jgi:hypothetical protein
MSRCQPSVAVSLILAVASQVSRWRRLDWIGLLVCICRLRTMGMGSGKWALRGLLAWTWTCKLHYVSVNVERERELQASFFKSLWTKSQNLIFKNTIHWHMVRLQYCVTLSISYVTRWSALIHSHLAMIRNLISIHIGFSLQHTCMFT